MQGPNLYGNAVYSFAFTIKFVSNKKVTPRLSFILEISFKEFFFEKTKAAHYHFQKVETAAWAQKQKQNKTKSHCNFFAYMLSYLLLFEIAASFQLYLHSMMMMMMMIKTRKCIRVK